MLSVPLRRLLVCAALPLLACGEPTAAVDVRPPDAGAADNRIPSADIRPEIARPPGCLQQDVVVQKAVDAARLTPNAVVAVRNIECGLALYASGNPANATSASVFLLASFTKTYVAAATLALVKDGTLQLDQPVATWLTSFDPKYQSVTVRMLLNHRSGIFNYTEDGKLYVDPKKVWTPQELVDLAFTHSPYFAPDAGHYYSNTNFIILGILIEKVTGKKVSAVLRERVLVPNNLAHTYLSTEEQITDPVAKIFNLDGTAVANPQHYSVLWTAGAMAGTAADVANWLWALFDERTALPTAQLDEMMKAASDCEVFPKEAECKYGLGLCIVKYTDAKCGTGIGHNGGWQGTSVDAFYFGDRRTAIAVLQNAALQPPTTGREVVLVSVINKLFPN